MPKRRLYQEEAALNYKNFSMTLGRKIANVRKLKGMSQRELARLVQVTPSYITKIEAGTNNMGTSLEIYYWICHELHLHLRELFTFTKYDRQQALAYEHKKRWIEKYRNM